MVSRTRAFTIATAWILAGLILGIAGFSAAAGTSSDGLRAAIVGSLLWGGILLAGCLIVAALWVGLGARTARSSAALGGQAALFGLAAALIALLLLAVMGQLMGDVAQ